MIDLNLFRVRVGAFDLRSKDYGRRKKSMNYKFTGNYIPNFDYAGIKFNDLILYITYLYLIICIMSVTMAMPIYLGRYPSACYVANLSNFEFIHTHLTNVKLLYVTLIYFLVKRTCLRSQSRSLVFNTLYMRPLKIHTNIYIVLDCVDYCMAWCVAYAIGHCF